MRPTWHTYGAFLRLNLTVDAGLGGGRSPSGMWLPRRAYGLRLLTPGAEAPATVADAAANDAAAAAAAGAGWSAEATRASGAGSMPSDGGRRSKALAAAGGRATDAAAAAAAGCCWRASPLGAPSPRLSVVMRSAAAAMSCDSVRDCMAMAGAPLGASPPPPAWLSPDGLSTVLPLDVLVSRAQVSRTPPLAADAADDVTIPSGT